MTTTVLTEGKLDMRSMHALDRHRSD